MREGSFELPEEAMAKKRAFTGANGIGLWLPAGQNYGARYESKKTRRSAGAVKQALRKVGNGRKRVEQRLAC
jgi:hypothetical protein